MKIIKNPIKKTLVFNRAFLEAGMNVGVKMFNKDNFGDYESASNVLGVFQGVIVNIEDTVIEIQNKTEQDANFNRFMNVKLENLQKGNILMVVEKDMFSPRYSSQEHPQMFYGEADIFITKERNNPNKIRPGQILTHSEGADMILEVTSNEITYIRIDENGNRLTKSLSADEYSKGEFLIIDNLNIFDIQKSGELIT